MIRKNVVVLFSLLIFSFSFSEGNLDKNLERGLTSIRPTDAYDYVKVLSSPEFAGRLTGHKGYNEAAKWAAKKFSQWGLKPLSKKEGYLQAFPAPYTIVDKAEMSLILPEKKTKAQETPSFKEVRLELEKDFLPLLFSDSGDHTAELVFAGWAISAPELGYDDYAGLEVQGKFILCFRGTPDAKDKRFQKYDHHRFRMKTAKQKGALGLFYIQAEPGANPNGERITGFTPAVLSEKVADEILKEKEVTCRDLKNHLQTRKQPLSFSLASKIHFLVESSHFPAGVGYNIIGYAEGSDPILKQECLVIGGHFDHCGFHLGLLFAGADDNASGSAAVMEIAEAFSQLKKKPKRSVVFILFGGEEMGLLGSNYFVEHLPSRFKEVDTMFNFDMVGEGEGTVCIHSPQPPEFKKVLVEADKHVNTLRRTAIIPGIGVRSSDFAPFFQKGATCAVFVSNGPHLHYHQTGDTIYRINPDIMADIARLAFLSAFAWADR